MKKSLFIFIFILSYSCFAQFSKTHYIPPLSCSEEDSSKAQEQYLYISTPSSTPVNFKIINLGGTTVNGSVSKSNPYVYNIGYGSNTQLICPRNNVNSVRKNKGFIIEAEDLIYVSARVIAGNANQSGSVVSKGLAALGTEFRIGALLNTLADPFDQNHYTFVSILATENNTTIEFSDIKSGVSLINNSSTGSSPPSILLNSGESFVMAVEGPKEANRDGLIGSLVSSDKPIAVNCGSFTGSNANTNLDLGFDQIVSFERTGKEYVFIKSSGQDIVEKVLLVAHEDNTDIFLNNNTSIIPDFKLDAGKYLVLDGSKFNLNGNLYIKTTKNVFAYQTIGDDSRTDFANQELFFVPPLSCETPHVIDNIPLINEIGNRFYQISRITIIVEKNATLDFEVDGVPYSLASLDSQSNIFVNGPTVIDGNDKYETYSILGLNGNIGVFSSGQLYLAAYGTDDAATFGGFYSGFTFKPEVSFNLVDPSKPNCIPNTKLSVNSLSPFDIFQWYFNDVEISGATSSSYTPTQPGYYYVKATIGDCGTELKSDKIPVSNCPTNNDNDLANDNIDLDIDNDGIVNCTESLGNQNVDLSNSAELNITTSGNGVPSNNPFSISTDGDFITETAIGKNNSVSFTKTFNEPTRISLEYVINANPQDLINSDAEFIANSDFDKTLTVLNPDNQLLIDTNYDGIYESGITQFSSFEIRFRLNNATPLAAGTGTFQIKSHLLNSFKFTHINLSDNSINRATFKLIATCVPTDLDLDGIPDQLDLDSDNDGIPDTVEAQGQNFIAFSNTDINKDGLDDAYGNGLIPIDSDNDSIKDIFDLDSDNNGIFDIIESGSNAIDSNFDGRIDGDSTSFGLDGLSNSIETSPDSGVLNYVILDTDNDSIKNYIELDNDNDNCFDTIEADFSDDNYDGILGNNPPITNENGMVLNSGGYTVLPNLNYITQAPISITVQPTAQPICELETLYISAGTSQVDSYQWQIFSNGNWIDLIDDATYANTKTNILEIKSVVYNMNGNKYRLKLEKSGNSCGLITEDVSITVYDLPIITTPESITQCDDDTDGISIINLTQKESFIANTDNLNFTYYKSLTAAKTGDESSIDFISNPTQFKSGNTTVWVRVVNTTHGCFQVAQLDVFVISTQIKQSYTNAFFVCDDFLDLNGNDNANNDDRDGISSFDFSSVTDEINATLPTGTTYSIKYYKNSDDAYKEVDENGNSLEITNISNYRNIDYPNQQKIWIRVESTLTNACFGLGFITLTVEKLPFAYPINPENIVRHCDDNHDSIYAFDTSQIQQSIVKNQTNIIVTYFDENGNQMTTPLPNPLIVTNTKSINVRVTNTVTNSTNGACYDEETIQFIVDDLPEAFQVPTELITVCDDEKIPEEQDGEFSFDTSEIQNAILNGQTGFVVKYFDETGNPLKSPLPNPFKTNTQTIKVIVENPINTSCFAEISIPFTIYPLPMIDLNLDGADNELVCSNIPEFTVNLDAGLLNEIPSNNYTYQWFLDGKSIPNASLPTLEVNQSGLYTVEVTNSVDCSVTRIIKVDASDIAQIEAININDLSDNNTVEIIVSGPGDYIYSIDMSNSFQTSNYFTNVSAGIHQVYVKDIKGCGTVGPIEIAVLGIPKFFTPNNDSYNDTWNIKGANTDFNRNTIVRIFDRFGKLIKQTKPDSDGWDGTFNGKNMPSDDYWYSITLEDNRVFKGHFSLKR